MTLKEFTAQIDNEIKAGQRIFKGETTGNSYSVCKMKNILHPRYGLFDGGIIICENVSIRRLAREIWKREYMEKL